MPTTARCAAIFLFGLLATAPAIELPRGLNIEGARDVQKLTLGDAVELVLKNNLEVQFDKVDIKVEEARKRFAAGVYDPVLSINASRESAERPDTTANLTTAESAVLRQLQGFPQAATIIFDQDSDRIEASVQGRTPLGTRFAVSARQSKIRSTFAGDTREVVPFYQAFGGIEIRQPLLKDFGPAANLREIRIARISQRIAELAWQESISVAIVGTLGNYFDMIFAQSDLAVRQEAVAGDEKLVQQNQRRLELGFMSPIDVQQARAQVSLDLEQQLGSKSVFMERQFALRRLISREAEETKSRIYLPVETPNLTPPKIDRGGLLAIAFENRMDYRIRVADAEKQDIQLRFARNQLWPTLDVVGTYGFNGLSDHWDSARDAASSSQAPQWSIGVQFSVPLGGVQPRAQLDAVKGLKEEAILRIKQSELTVTVDVDTALSRIETNRQRLETARQTRELNEEAVRIGFKRLEEGQISSFDLIEQRRKVYDARSRELAAQAELNKSIATLWQATGTVLEHMGIEVVKTGKHGRELDAVRTKAVSHKSVIVPEPVSLPSMRR